MVLVRAGAALGRAARSERIESIIKGLTCVSRSRSADDLRDRVGARGAMNRRGVRRDHRGRHVTAILRDLRDDNDTLA